MSATRSHSIQPDFLRGAAAAEGGQAIICLASATDDGQESRIRPLLHEGEGVTVARSDVHYVITEYGIAYLFGRSVSERAIALKRKIEMLYVTRDQQRKLVKVEPERIAINHQGQQVLVARDLARNERLSYQVIQIERMAMIEPRS